MIRFNRSGEFNVPFCRKRHRFSIAYITKIVNQISHVEALARAKPLVFKSQRFEKTIAACRPGDVVYCDPPYIDRHADYYNSWDTQQEEALFKALSSIPGKFILSTWHHNDYRENRYVKSLWREFNVLTRKHFYHVGAKEANRNPMVEALVTNFDTLGVCRREGERREQLELFDGR